MATDISDPSAPQYGVNLVPDIDFAEKDPTVIQAEVIADYEAAFLSLTNIAKSLAPGDPVRLHLLVVCHWLSHQRTIIDFTGKMNLLKYAHDDYLDNLAALHGNRTLRLRAAPASTTLEFTLVAPLAFDTVVPAGTQVQAPNSIVFETSDDAPFVAGGLTAQIKGVATLDGTMGNDFLPGQVNQVINWNQPFALSVKNTDTTAGGADDETDDQYRYRIWLAIESYSTCGPHDAYEFWALSADPGIIQAVVYSAPNIAGEVWIYPLMRGGLLPDQDILDKVLASCSDVKRRPVSDFVSVFAPSPFNYTLDMDYWIEETNEVLADTIQANVTQAVNDWILWQHSYVSRDLNCDELRKRCLEAGAKRIVVRSPSPDFQTMQYNQLAVHSTSVPAVNYKGLEPP